MLKASHTFFAALPDGTTVNHLCLFLTDEGGFLSSVFVVPVMTPTDRSDTTTLLEPRDHPFLKYASYVSYAHLVEQDRKTLIPKIDRHDVPINQECLARVIAGVFKSPLTPRGVRRDFQERLREIRGGK